jgi:hypothetical protein
VADEDDGKRRIEITEGQVIRWACYVGFFYCTISMVTALSSNTTWLGYLLGTIAFGTPALKMYVLYQDRERTAQSQAQYAAKNAGGGRARFQGLDAEGGS